MAKKPMHKLGVLAALGAVAIGTLVAAVPSQAATTAPPVSSGSTYLALGDSIAFGYRETDSVNFPSTAYADASDFVGYPEIVAKDLHLKVTNAACPGETTSAMLNVNGQDNGCQTDYQGSTADAYRPNFPLHTDYGSAGTSQLQYADAFLKAHPKTKLITMQFGANDGFVCQKKKADHCTSPAELEAVGNKITRNVGILVKNLRNKMHYTGQLVLVNYYSVDSANSTANQQSQLVNAALYTATRGYHVVTANAYKLFQTASQNATGADPTCSAGLLTNLTDPTPTAPCGVHPSRAGSALIAAAVERSVQNA